MSVPGISQSVMSKIRSAITKKEMHHVQGSTFDLIAEDYSQRQHIFSCCSGLLASWGSGVSIRGGNLT